MDFPIARQYFYQEVHQPDEQISLERAALYLAKEEYPELEIEEYLNALDIMAEEIRERLPTDFYPLRIIRSINAYLFEDLKFQGNETEYYDPCNSFLNDVIDRRMGIPITLSLVYLAIAKRLDFPMVGIGMPGHFLIRPVIDEMDVFVDPFHQGEILFQQDCKDRFAQVFDQWEFEARFLEPVTGRQFLARMLTNLKVIYLNRGDVRRALSAIERILFLFPNAPIELRDRGVLYYRLNRLMEARQDLETYLSISPTADDARVVRQLLMRMNQGT